MNKKYSEPRKIESDIVLNEQKSFFSIVIPEEGVNLVYNPETFNQTGYTSNKTIHQQDFTHHGIYSFRSQFVENDYIYYQVPTSLNNDQNYTFSLSMFGTSKVELTIRTSGDVILGKKIVQLSEFWHRYSVTAHISTNPSMSLTPPFSNARLYVKALGDGNVYTSAWQLENKEYATTFISGTQPGLTQNESPISYYWQGAPHASPSVRTKFTRSGGKIVNFKDIGIKVTGYEGLGMPEFEYSSTSLINKYGQIFNGSNITERSFTILGIIYARNMAELMRTRSYLTNSISATKVPSEQPVKLLFQVFDCEMPLTHQVEFTAVYEGGLDGDYTSQFGEKIGIDFKMFDPLIYKTGNRSLELCLYSTPLDLDDPDGIFYRDKNGVWTSTPTVNSALVKAIGIGADNYVYYGVNNSFAPTDPIMYQFDGVNMNVIANGGEELDEVLAICPGPDGKLYVGGGFQKVTNGTSTVSEVIVDPGIKKCNIARYNLATGQWEDIGRIYTAAAGIQSYVKDITVLQDGRICVVGKFDRVTFGPNPIDTILVRNMAFFYPETGTWTILSPTENGVGQLPAHYLNCVKEDPVGRLWVGGKFTNNPNYENICHFLRNYDGTYSINWVDPLIRRSHRTSNVPSGEAEVMDIEVTQAGEVIAAGKFDSTKRINDYEFTVSTTIKAQNVPYYIAKYNNGNAGWDSLGYIATVGPAIASKQSTVIFDLENQNGELYFSGIFNYVGSQKTYPYDIGTADTYNPNDVMETFTENTFAIAKYSGNLLKPDQAITATIPTNVFGPLKIKAGGFYSNFGFQSIFVTPPTAGQNLSSAGYDTPFYTTLVAQPVSFICTTELPFNCGDAILPIITIRGPGKLISIRNYTANLAVVSFNKTLVSGETLIIDYTKAIPEITSSIYGKQNNIILPGSSLNTFRLFQGTNNISVFLDRETTNLSETSAFITWRSAFFSIDSAVTCVDTGYIL